MEKKYGYVELTFPRDTTRQLQKIVEDVVPNDQLYYSDLVSRIKGDVSDKAHFTLFYGLEPAALNNPNLQELVSKMKIAELQPSRLVLFAGYQGQYKVLCLEIFDAHKSLVSLVNQLLEFEHDAELGEREFKPHITLAYVQSGYELPEGYALDDKPIGVGKVALKI